MLPDLNSAAYSQATHREQYPKINDLLASLLETTR